MWYVPSPRTHDTANDGHQYGIKVRLTKKMMTRDTGESRIQGFRLCFERTRRSELAFWVNKDDEGWRVTILPDTLPSIDTHTPPIHIVIPPLPSPPLPSPPLTIQP
jgi:hypothetical protein